MDIQSKKTIEKSVYRQTVSQKFSQGTLAKMCFSSTKHSIILQFIHWHRRHNIFTNNNIISSLHNDSRLPFICVPDMNAAKATNIWSSDVGDRLPAAIKLHYFIKTHIGHTSILSTATHFFHPAKHCFWEWKKWKWT